jgi:hypothetical protein
MSGQSRPKAGCWRKGFIYGQALKGVPDQRGIKRISCDNLLNGGKPFRLSLSVSSKISHPLDVKRNEAGVHRAGRSIAADIDGVGVPSDMVFRFKDHDSVPARKQAGRRPCPKCPSR